ncbi:MAG: RND transporter [Alphaproteobacteria bacterium]|nr:MAG: RND transporter [Alphaproteobacteria bacterium]
MAYGFGLVRLGLLALRFPLVASVLVLVVTLAAGLGLPRLGFSGANVDILRDGSREIADYDTLLQTFRNFNNDAVVLIRADNLATVDGFETYRDLHFEFQFDDRVQSVLSLFSLVQYSAEQGGWHSAVPARFDSDEEVAAFLDAIAREIPNSQSLLGRGHDSAVIVVYAKPEAVTDAAVRETMAHLQSVASQFEGEGITITIAGQPAIRSGLITDIIGDLVRLLPLALIFCAIIAWLIFRSIPAMAITAVAPLGSVVWLLGGMGLAGVEVSFLTNVLPVLLTVVVFADALHLFIKWERLAREGGDPVAAIGEAIETVGPACIVSALTTAVALFSLTLSRNYGLIELGIIGGLAVLASLVAVMVALPLVIHWAVRAGYRPRQRGASRLAVAAAPAIRLLSMPRAVAAAGLLLCVVGGIAHFNIGSRFQLVDYLSSSSAVAVSEGFIDARYPGSTPLFVILERDMSRPLLDGANIERFDSALEAVAQVFPASSFYSLADFRSEIEKGGGEISEEALDSLPDYMTSRFISPARDKVLITIFASANLSANEMQVKLKELDRALDARGIAAQATVTGFPVLSAIVAPRLMDRLRLSLVASIGLSILLIAFAARSWRHGLACLLPNLLPILTVELVLWIAGIPLNMTVAVSLTVAFGLAVNDSIHLLNQYILDERRAEPAAAMQSALVSVLPAMASTTLILSGGLAIMLASSLPAIALFSGVMMLTLVFALVFDVLQLPALILLLSGERAKLTVSEPA